MNIRRIQDCLNNYPDVSAAYLFGSAVTDDSVANDVDLLVLLAAGADKLVTHARLAECLSKFLKIPAKKIDIVFMDLDEVEPKVLFDAIDRGILLKNMDENLLSDHIESISRYFLTNEPVIHRAQELRKERVEAFCEN